MSEKNDPTEHYLQFAVGIFKIDHMSAGFPDLRRIAERWAEDSNFKELIVRGVSETNFGIQFIYLSKDAEKSIKHYKSELQELYGSDFYAWDYNTSISSGEKDSEKVKKSVENMQKMIVRSEKVDIV